jgi:hypothetical protein
VGVLGAIEAKAPTATSTACGASGDLGALVVVPSGGKSAEVAFKVVAGVGRDAASCVPPYGDGCIVARRSIRFVPHTDLRLLVPMRAACNGVACGDRQTCVAGACASAEIADPNACAGAPGCDEGALGGTSAPDGGADAPADAPEGGGVADAEIDVTPEDALPVASYGDIRVAANWSAFDISAANGLASGYRGVSFDGRYVYFIPGLEGGVGSPYGLVAVHRPGIVVVLRHGYARRDGGRLRRLLVRRALPLPRPERQPGQPERNGRALRHASLVHQPDVVGRLRRDRG